MSPPVTVYSVQPEVPAASELYSAPPKDTQPLTYAKSGVLMSSKELISSMRKRHWFAAAISCSVFVGMLTMIGSNKDVAMYSTAPF